MATEKEIKDLAVEYAWDHFPSYPTELGDIQDAYTQGYQVCQETIPSECIGFAEWVVCQKKVVHWSDGWHLMFEDGSVNGRVLSESELYSIYLESLKQNI